jgi:hypothetical protein
VNGPGHNILPRADFAGDQHRRVRGSNPRDAFAHIVHGWAVAVDFRRALQPNDRIFQQDVFAEQPGALAGTAYRRPHHLRLERLDQEIKCPAAHTLDCRLDTGNLRQKNHRQRGIVFVRGRQHGRAFSAGHFLLGDDDFEIVCRQSALSFFDAFRFHDLVLVLTQVRRQSATQVRFVVNQKNSSHRYLRLGRTG